MNNKNIFVLTLHIMIRGRGSQLGGRTTGTILTRGASRVPRRPAPLPKPATKPTKPEFNIGYC